MLEEYDEYFRRAKMFTGIHAKAPGARVQSQENDSTCSADADNPTMKKAKNEKKTDKKKSLRRL